MSISDVSGVTSIIIALFAWYQANESAHRAEELNKQTQDSLTEIKACLAKIDAIIDKQQTKQLNVINNTSNALIDVVKSAMAKGGNQNGKE